MKILCTLALLAPVAPPARAQERPVQPNPDETAAVEHFEAHVRPLLAEHCIECHSGDKPKGDLRLDTVEGLRAGAAGEPIFVAGDLENSLIVEAVRYEDPFTAMPPDGELADDEVRAIERWIELVEAVVGEVAEAVAREGAAITTDPLGGPALTANPERSAAIRSLLSRAFRRPATDAEVQRRVTLVDRALASGCAPQAVTAEVLRSTLLSPSFIFRLEEERPLAPAPWLVDGYELAARLSLFLWGTLPDTQLVADAEAGRLVGEGPARAAADRMLRDPRARWLAEDFAAQWLGFRELEDVTPDVRRFRAFTPALRRDFQLEAEAFFADLVAEDRSVLEILDSNHAFLNDRLAAHYGLAGVGHRDIRRTPIADRRRGGVLGMGAILTVTSTPLRTSPVQRGQWVLERLLGRSAPPPPPDAGSLPEDDRQKDGLSLRERLEAHRAQPACAGCHALFDPYGLALESFDGLGRWRDGRTGEPPISTRVTLPSGSEVDGPVGLKIALRRDPQRFLTTLQRALFTYAIGRPPGLGDDKHLRGALEDAAREDYRFSALVDGIVSSPAFTSRRNP